MLTTNNGGKIIGLTITGGAVVDEGGDSTVEMEWKADDGWQRDNDEEGSDVCVG